MGMYRRVFKVTWYLTLFSATLRLFPGISGATIKAFCMQPVRGVVLETFGAGNAPQRSDIIEALKDACERGIIIVAISQCAKGMVSDAYETGRNLLQIGVVPGGDMTPEVCPVFSFAHPVTNKAYSAPLQNYPTCCRSQNFRRRKSEVSLAFLYAAS